MARPPLDIGTYGRINITEQGPATYRAAARFRDASGRTVQVTKYGQTKGRAERALKKALAERQEKSGPGITAETTVTALADLWTAANTGWAVRTREVYGNIVEHQVKPRLGGVRLRELRPSAIAAALTKIRDTSGPGAAKTTKSVLAGMFDYAIAHDAMQGNPARVKVKLNHKTKSPRALTVEETEYVCDALRTDKRAVNWDLPDLVDFMLGTGMRIGEACAVRSSVLDLEAGTVEVNATVVRMKGVSLVVQERTKTAAGWRVLALPDYLVELLRRRRSEQRLATDTVTMLEVDGKTLRTERNPGIVFTTPRGKLRETGNTEGDLRTFFDGLGCDACERTGYQHDERGEIMRDKNRQPVRCSAGPFSWVTSHTFRKTVATRMDEAGCSAREIADQLGQSQPSLAQDVYMGRKVVSAKAAKVLDR